jgi:hypothetical protein
MCRRASHWLPQLVGRELPKPEARRCELHLSICETCRQAAVLQGFDSAQTTQERISDEGFAEFRSRLAFQLATSSAATLPEVRTTWLYAAAVLVIVAVGVVMLR